MVESTCTEMSRSISFNKNRLSRLSDIPLLCRPSPAYHNQILGLFWLKVTLVLCSEFEKGLAQCSEKTNIPLINICVAVT